MASHSRDKFGNRYANHKPNAPTRKMLHQLEDERQFRGVDGEGGNVHEEGTLFGTRHQYLSLRAGPDLLETGRPLGFRECFDFLCNLSPSYIYVAYFFDYDVTMMIRTLPKRVAQQLLNRHLRGSRDDPNWTIPVSFDGYDFDYLPHKEFKVRRTGTKRWIIISDVGQFFQGAFLSTLKKWSVGTPDELAMIEKGKSMRADFTEFTDETRAYNALECVLLEQLMTDFRVVCSETGYVPKKWQGPGYLASAMLAFHGVPKRDDIPILKNAEFYNLALAGYYGGRFEISGAGPIRGPVYQYDINGAYVGLLRGLPCLTHGSWRQVRDRPDNGIWFGMVHFNHSAPRFLYNLPVRYKNGNINYPKEGNGVYWSTELDAAERAGTVLSFKSGWLYESHCDCRWFDFVDDYYAKRLALGKSTKGYVLKLSGNSIYGKLAQSIGYAPWANPVWAGLITAGCRAQLIDAYSQDPDDTYMLATDGIFVSKQLSLLTSRELGDWEETIHPDGMFIVQPGIYFIGDESKTRGVERGRINAMRADFETQWQKFLTSHGLDHTVSIPVQNFITARQAIQRNRWDLAGVWETTTRELSFNWEIKRKSGYALARNGNLRTIPHNGGPDLTSVPYARRIGGNLQIGPDERYTDPGLIEKSRMEEQPDWVQPLLGE
jgi:hypothetical protein